MRDLPRIEAVWPKIDLVLENERAKSTGVVVGKILAEQVVNDQAYFILCWGQLETEIDGKCRDAVRHRRANADWGVRRGWDLYNPDDDRFSGLSFENRVRLVLDSKVGRGSPYSLTLTHYNIRNRIAHGSLQLTRIGVSDFVQDCYTIQAALHRSI